MSTLVRISNVKKKVKKTVGFETFECIFCFENNIYIIKFKRKNNSIWSTKE